MTRHRNPQVYHGHFDENGKLIRENLDKINFKKYIGNPLGDIDIAFKNAQTRINTLVGYRNERAYKSDTAANTARLEIMLDELHFAGFDFRTSSEQTQGEQ